MVPAALMTIAQMADLITARVSQHGPLFGMHVSRHVETNPIAAVVTGDPALAMITKVTLLAFVCALSVQIARKHRRTSNAVLLFGSLVGIVGTISNVV